MGTGPGEGRSGRRVDAIEINQGSLDQGMARLRASLDRAVSRGRLTDTARDEILARIRPTDDVATGVADADLGDPAFTPVPLLAEYATAGTRFRAGAEG